MELVTSLHMKDKRGETQRSSFNIKNLSIVIGCRHRPAHFDKIIFIIGEKEHNYCILV